MVDAANDLANPAHPYHRAARGTWLIARTAVTASYPCRCSVVKTCNPTHCPCSGRADALASMPSICCARRRAETAARRQDAAA